MSKSQDAKKTPKKEPAKTPKEKKAAKKGKEGRKKAEAVSFLESLPDFLRRDVESWAQ